MTSWHGQLSLHAFRPSEPVFDYRGRSVDPQKSVGETYHTSPWATSAASDRFILARLINDAVP